MYDCNEKVLKIVECPDICVSNQALQDAIDEDNMELDDNYVPTTLPKYKGIEDEDIYDAYNPQIITKLITEQK